MSFTWLAPQPLRTREQIAQIVHQVALGRGLDELATVIALMTVSTETGIGVGDDRTWRCPANPADPTTLDYPHDSLSNDANSSGYFQQRPPWWGTAKQRMTLRESADMFLAQLSPDYHRAAADPYQAGMYAQKVQGSAYPDRYARAWSEAWTVLRHALNPMEKSMTYYDTDRSNEFTFGGPRNTANIVGICIHDTEGVTSAQADSQTANNVTTYQINSRSGSYHVMVGVDGTRIRQNTDSWATWSTGNKGNDILLHLCFVGSASQTRAEWLAQDKMLRAGATVVRYWADKYNIPLRRVDAAHLPGILGHADTRVWGGTDHTDPGENFPFDVLIQYAADLGAQPSAPPTETGVLMALTDAEQHELLDRVRYISDQLGPNLWGPDSSMGTNAAGEELTLRDGLAAHIRKADAR